MEHAEPQAHSRHNGLRADFLVLLVTAVLAAVFHTTYRGRLIPHVGLSGDPANIAGFAAGIDHPELFEGDALLEDRNNYRFYGSLQVDLIRWLNRFYHDYGSSNDALLGAHFWAYAFGWYVFGALFWGARWCGLLWMFANLVIVHMNLSEFWGLSPDLLPRISFQSALPWLLSLTLWLAPRSPRFWPLLLGLSGLAVWLHPVSAPAWAGAIWVSLCVVPAPGLTRQSRLQWMLLSSIVLALALLPFAMLYFGAKQPSLVDHSVLRSIGHERIGRAFYDVLYAVAGFCYHMTRTGLLPLALWGLWLWRRIDLAKTDAVAERRRWAVAWLVGLLIVSVGLPGLDQLIAAARQQLPAQIDLVRNLRYLVPFLIGAWLWPLILWTNSAADDRSRRHRTAVVVAVVVLWTSSHRPLGLGAWPREDAILQQAIVAVRANVPARGRVLTIGINGLPVRYGALRPVVFAEKDGGCFLQVRPDKLPEWFRVWKRYRHVDTLSNSDERLMEGAALARQLGAEYLLMRDYPPVTPPAVNLRILFSNASYRLYSID